MIKYKQGYSLIELMITVAVIGIIAAVSIPAYQQYVTNSQISACARYIMPFRLIATNLIVSDNSSIAGVTTAALGLVDSPECTNTNSIIAGEVLTISGDAADGRTFQMVRSNVANGGAWSCGIAGDLANTTCNDFN